MDSFLESSDLLVLSHLRWDFIYQRPHHILSRHAENRRVFYFEEPIFGLTDTPRLHLKESSENVQIAVPYLPYGMSNQENEYYLKELLDELISDAEIKDFSLWLYSPKALNFSRHLQPSVVIYDCLDELSFMENEQELINLADVVFTASHSLYEAKKDCHRNIHQFSSSMDSGHFSRKKITLVDPDDQHNIPHPRIGFCGLIDDRINLSLVERMADLRPEFQFIMIGPIVNIDSASLPLRPNIHYLGKKEYQALPHYIASWDCAFMPFILNDSTRFFGPAMTPEFLAAGIPVVSTAIHDVIHPYADAKLVYIANDPSTFVDLIQSAMNERAYDPEWIEKVDAFLEGLSWETTFTQMARIEGEARKKVKLNHRTPAYEDMALRSIGLV